jgi:tRNA A22 N-methylase
MRPRADKNDPGQSTNANEGIEENKFYDIISKEIDKEDKNIDPKSQNKTAFGKSIINKGQKKFAEDDKKNVNFVPTQSNSYGNNSTKTML